MGQKGSEENEQKKNGRDTCLREEARRREGGAEETNEWKQRDRDSMEQLILTNNIRETRHVAGDRAADRVLSKRERNLNTCEPCSIQDAAPSCREGHSQSPAHMT